MEEGSAAPDNKRPRVGSDSDEVAAVATGGGGASSSDGGGGAAAADAPDSGEPAHFQNELTTEERQWYNNERILSASRGADNLGLFTSRPSTTGLGGVQGAHVTAYGLVKRALSAIFAGIRDDDNAFSNKWFRERRDRVHKFIEKLILLDNAGSLEEGLKSKVQLLMDRYNSLRSRKTGLKLASQYYLSDVDLAKARDVAKITAVLRDLKSNISDFSLSTDKDRRIIAEVFSSQLIVGDRREKSERMQQLLSLKFDSTEPDELKIYEALVDVHLDAKSILESIFEANKVKNARLIEETCRHLTIHTMRFYNKLPDVAFHHTKESKNRLDGKMFESASLNKLDNAPQDLSDSDLISVIDGLLDYKELTITDESSEPGHRDNSIPTLVNLVARHLYLFFSAYPEAGKKYGFDIYALATISKKAIETLFEKIIQPFCYKFISENWGSLSKDRRTVRRTVNSIFAKFEVMIKASLSQTDLATMSEYSQSSSDSDDDRHERDHDAASSEISTEQKIIKEAIGCLVGSSETISAEYRSKIQELERQVAFLTKALEEKTSSASVGGGASVMGVFAKSEQPQPGKTGDPKLNP